MSDTLPPLTGARILVAGIDPAAHTGLVVLELPAHVGPRAMRLALARWSGSARLNPIKRKALDSTQETELVWRRLHERIVRWGVTEVAIEEPSDALRSWNGQGQKGQRTGTAFAMGRSFERAVVACQLAGARVHAYRVTEWMPKATAGRLKHTQKREHTLAQLDEYSRELRDPTGGPYRRSMLSRLSDDELMALGVLRHHLARQVPTP